MNFNTGIEKELDKCKKCGELYWGSGDLCYDCKRKERETSISRTDGDKLVEYVNDINKRYKERTND